MPLLLRHLLDDPGLGLELVAGHAGLETRGPVRWAHISEIPDPTPWLEGGEVLLTTGLGVRDSPELQRRLISGLVGRGCPGLGFGLGVVVDAVPAAMLEQADALALPLFTVPYELPFIAVTKRVSREVFSEHDATLRAAIDLHRSVLAAVLGGAGIRGVLETASRLMPDLTLLVYDYYGQVVGRAGRNRPETLDARTLWPEIRAARQTRDHFSASVNGLTVQGAAIRLGEGVEGMLVVAGHRSIDDHEQLLLEQAVTGVSLELARGLSVRESHRARVDELLEEVAENRIGQRALKRRLSRLGYRDDQGFRVLCLRSGDTRVSARALCGVVEDALSADSGTPILGRYDGGVYCVVQPAVGTHAQQIAAAVRARGWTGVEIGRSRPKTDVEALDSAVREATAAADRTGPGEITDIDALGLPGILAGLGGDEAALAFVAQVLGPVVAHDEREGSDLVATLRAYLAHGCRPGPAAAQLGIHRHTLAYRLERVTRLTGRDLRNGDAIVEIGLALRLHAATEGAPA